MSVRRSLILLSVLTLALPVVTFAAVQRLEQNAAEQEARTEERLQFYTVQRGAVEVVVSAVGTIEAEQVVNLAFTVPGRVEQVLAQPGAYVLAGDVLAQLESGTQQLAYDQAALALERAQLALDELMSPPSESELAVAQANVDAAWGAFLSIQNAVTPEQIQAAELAYAQAQQALADAQTARSQGAGGGTLADAQVGQATFNVEIARLRLVQLQNGSPAALNAAYARAIQAQAEYDRLLAGPPQAQIDQAQVAIDQAQADLDQALVTLQRRQLIAPFDGVLSAVNIEVGALVAPGVGLVEITDVSPLALTVQVDEIDVAAIREGLPARVTLDALPDVEFPAQLERIALVGRSVNNIITYDVLVTLNAEDPRLRIGMTAEATVVVERRENTLVVPNLFIRLDRRTDQAFVNVAQADGTLVEVEVTLGLRGQDESEIVSGIDAGTVLAADLGGDNLGSIFGG
ncbi:MAG: efflux RND transporter periplasmic adaptor subunit [Chloroflexi bacterium]|nr:efflux RND transporter periplasmic adaptor subunit [Chloroflexota bacterium]